MNRKARVQALKDAALPLFLRHGVENVSVDDITAAARMAKGGFYRYFVSQAGLVEAMLKPTRDVFVGAFEACGRQLEMAQTKDALSAAYRLIGDGVATMLLEHPGEVRLYLQECRGPAVGARVPIIKVADEVFAHALDLTHRARRHGLTKPNIPAPVSALTVVGAVERLVLAVLQEEDVGNPLEVPAALTSLILDGLRA